MRDWLDRFPFAAGLSDSGRETIRASAACISLPEGTVILNEGCASDPVLLVARGSVRVFKQTGDGREITLYRVTPGELCVVGVASALSELPYAATASAADPVQGHALPATVFRRLFSTEPALQSFVMRTVADRFAKVVTTVVEVGFQRLDQRLARFLLGASAERGVVTWTHEQIARELGTAREVITRALDSFESAGLVSLSRRRIEISRPVELNRFARNQVDKT